MSGATITVKDAYELVDRWRGFANRLGTDDDLDAGLAFGLRTAAAELVGLCQAVTGGGRS